MVIYFRCGCLFSVKCEFTHELAGLACCERHERPHAQLNELGYLEVERVELEDRR